MMHFAAIFCFVLVLFFFLRFQKMTWTPGSNRNLALFHKGMATFSAFLLSLVGAFLQPTAGNILLCGGLLVCTAADVVLGKNLMRGMAVFGLGHVFYCIAYWMKTPPTRLSLIIFFLLLILCFFLYPQIKKRSGSKPPLPFLCYGVLLFLMLALAFFGGVFISATSPVGFLDALYETASAIATVGLTTGVTGELTVAGQILIIIYMYFGRVGVLTLSLGFLMGDRAVERFRYADTNLLIG